MRYVSTTFLELNIMGRREILSRLIKKIPQNTSVLTHTLIFEYFTMIIVYVIFQRTSNLKLNYRCFYILNLNINDRKIQFSDLFAFHSYFTAVRTDIKILNYYFLIDKTYL